MIKHGGYYGKENIFDLSINLGPYGMSEDLKEEINRIVKDKDMSIYPEILPENAIHSISKVRECKSDEVLITNGATQAIYLIARTFLFKKSLIIQPSFAEYERALKITNTKIHNYILDYKNKFKLDLKDLENIILKSKIDSIFICNPNNPTGHIYSDNIIKRLIEFSKEYDFKIIIDESFYDFYNKLSKYIVDDNIIIVRSMTKIYSIAGIRVGYIISSKKNINKLISNYTPWSLNSIAIELIPYLLKQNELIENTRKLIKKEKTFIYNELRKLNIEFFKSYSNFILIRHIGKNHFFKSVFNEGYFIRKCNNFLGLDDTFFRFVVKKRDENIKFIEVLRRVNERINFNNRWS